MEENLRKWFKDEDWVRIDTQGNIAGKCGTMKKGKAKTRCLPRKRAQGMSKAERKATVAKKVRGSKKGKQYVKVKETKENMDLKSIILKTLEKEGGAAGLKALAKASKTSKKDLEPKLNKMSGVKQHKHGDYISTPLSEVKDIIKVMLEDLSSNLNEKKKKKKDRCHRKADSVYGSKTSAYKSGAIVKCRKGMIWKKKANEEIEELKVPYRKSGYMGYSEPVEETDMTIDEVLNMKLIDENITEAKYKGRTVTLNKPMRGDSKKFKVYVNSGKKNADGSIKVKKVNFGHGGTTAKKAGQKTMKIRKSNPKARAAFRKRHRCDNTGPKTMARYWSCKKW